MKHSTLTSHTPMLTVLVFTAGELSPIVAPPGCDNMMLDMAVSADKGPFISATKANKSLQRALSRFLVYHEKERKVRGIEGDRRVGLGYGWRL